MRNVLRTLVLTAAVALAMGTASAQAPFPTRPVHILVPYPPGGGVDILSRTLGDELSKQWGQSVIVENRPGAGGIVASQALATSPPDGYTLIMVASGHATNAFLYKKLPYDTFKDFTPISLLASSPNILLVRADSPYKTLADLLAAARQKPGSLSYGMAGNGTSTHLAGELLKNLAKVDIVAIPYKGGTPAMNDLSGRADSDLDQQRAGIDGAAQCRHHSRARRHHRETGNHAARRSCYRRGRRSRLRHRGVVGPARAGQHAGRSAGQALP